MSLPLSPNRKNGTITALKQNNQKPILYNYLRYTYQRLTEEEKIVVSDDGQFITRFSHFQKLIGSSSGALGRRRDRLTARPEY